MPTKWVAQMPMPTETAAAQSQASCTPPVAAAGMVEQRDAGKAGQGADQSGHGDQPEIVVVEKRREDVLHERVLPGLGCVPPLQLGGG